MAQKRNLRRRFTMGLAVAIPVLGIAGGLTGLVYHSRQNFDATASRLRIRWQQQQQQGESKADLTSFQNQLQQLEAHKIFGVPAIWFAPYDGVQQRLEKLVAATSQTWQDTTNQDKVDAQQALAALEKTMGVFAKTNHAQRKQALKTASSPKQYLQLTRQWQQQKTAWLGAVAKLKAASGGFDDGQPADIKRLSQQLAALLQKAPAAAVEQAEAVSKTAASYWHKTPQQQLSTHTKLLQELRQTIKQVKSVEPEFGEAAASNPLGTPFQAYLKTRQSKVSVAVYDATSGQTYTYRPSLNYDTASIVKATIMADLLHRSEVDGQPLTSTEKSLMVPMIEQSDNTAASKLWSLAGEGSGVEGFLHSAGMTQTTPGQNGYWGLTSTTVRDQLDLMKLYAFPNSLLDSQDRQYGLNLMEHVVNWENWGVSTGAENHAVVALKNGWSPETPTDWRINSIGYIDGDGRDYVIAVLSVNNPSEQYGIQTVDEVGELVWEALG